MVLLVYELVSFPRKALFAIDAHAHERYYPIRSEYTPFTHRWLVRRF
jgi:hypothetical protein